MLDLASLRARNGARWRNAELMRASEFGPVAARLAAPPAKARYQAIEAQTGVPWFFIAVVHQRESSQDWTRSLAQGDPWSRRSTHVPKGRGPFASFQDAAVDALKNCAPFAAKNTDWSVGGLLTMLEQYNGLGYFNRGLPSPYIWSGTDQYVKGKYIADGKFDPDVVDEQLGCAGLILAMMQIDPSISLEAADTSAAAVKKLPAKPSALSPVNSAKGSIGALIAGFVSSIFKRAA